MSNRALQFRAPEADSVVIEIVRDSDGLGALRDEWTALHARAGKSHQVFQSHAWIATWAQHFASVGSVSLAITVVRRDGEAILIWPLALQRTLGVRRLIWAGAPVSQYGDVIAAPLVGLDEVLAQSWGHILAEFKPDIAQLRKVRADAVIAPFLHVIGAASSEAEEAPFMDFGIGATYDRYEQRYSGKARKNRRRLLRRLEEQGNVAFRHLGPGPESHALAMQAIKLKQAWLAQRGLVSPTLDDDRTAAFFVDICGDAGLSAGALVSVLSLDGAPCAIMVAIAGADRVCGHIFTYDLAFEKAGAGALLLEDCLRHACNSGYRYFDLLAPADAYKLDWSDEALSVSDWTITASLRGSLFERMHHLARSQWRNMKTSRSMAWIAKTSVVVNVASTISR